LSASVSSVITLGLSADVNTFLLLGFGASAAVETPAEEVVSSTNGAGGFLGVSNRQGRDLKKFIKAREKKKKLEQEKIEIPVTVETQATPALNVDIPPFNRVALDNAMVGAVLEKNALEAQALAMAQIEEALAQQAIDDEEVTLMFLMDDL